jgi:hypothetical protein
MLKKIISSVVLLAAVNVYAQSENYFASEWDAKGLLAIEGAGGTMNLTSESNSTILNDDDKAHGAVSLKLGGESKNYRLFLVGTYYIFDADNSTDSTAASLGLQVDYLIRAGEHFNVFLGLNGGGIRTDIKQDTVVGTISNVETNAYAGGQAGINIDIIDNLGLEFGARVKHVFTGSDHPYTIENIYEGYGSIVFKFTGDY